MTVSATVLVALAVGSFGLLIGSFLNVVVYRVPAGLSLVAPPSACPNCGSRIRVFDNIPIVSWLLLRGRCRNCDESISARYPAVEASTAIVFAGVAWGVTISLPASASSNRAVMTIIGGLALLYLAAISVALLLIDIDVHKLPNSIVLPAYLVGAALLTVASLANGRPDLLLGAAIGMAAMFVGYLLMALAYPGGMGLGDVKLAGVLGLYLGWTGWGALIVGFISAFVLGGIYSLVLIITKRANRKSGIPFGPWMLVGAWLGIAVGNTFFNSYLSFFGLPAI